MNSFTAGAAVHRSDLLTVLPRSFVPATGFASKLSICALPFEMPSIDVSLLWHCRHDQDTAQRWLRDVVARAATAISGPA
jgi:DNA-binding transcriptional LysR family regulator